MLYLYIYFNINSEINTMNGLGLSFKFDLKHFENAKKNTKMIVFGSFFQNYFFMIKILHILIFNEGNKIQFRNV